MKARAFVHNTPAELAKAITAWAEKEAVTIRGIGYAVHDGKCSALVVFVRGDAPEALVDLVERWKAAALAGVEKGGESCSEPQRRP